MGNKKVVNASVPLAGVLIINHRLSGTDQQAAIERLLRYHPVVKLVQDPAQLAAVIHTRKIPVTDVRKCSRVCIWSTVHGREFCTFMAEQCRLLSIPFVEMIEEHPLVVQGHLDGYAGIDPEKKS